jgi:hypothetical protein
MPDRVIRVAATIAAAIVLFVIVWVGLVHHHKAILNPAASSSIKDSSGQTADLIVKMTKEEAVGKAQGILSQLSINPGTLQKAEIMNDPVTLNEYWSVRFAGASVCIDPVSRTVFEVDDFPRDNLSSSKFIINDTAGAQKAAQEIYSKLQAPSEYKLIGVEKSHSGDFWSTFWAKEVIPGVFSKYESVNLLLSSDTGKLRSYRLFNTPARSLKEKVTEEQAVEIARPIAEAKGFKTFVNARLDVEQANNYWSSQGPSERPDYCTLVWVVTFKDSHGSMALFYVDALTGSVIGGDQTQ